MNGTATILPFRLWHQALRIVDQVTHLRNGKFGDWMLRVLHLVQRYRYAGPLQRIGIGHLLVQHARHKAPGQIVRGYRARAIRCNSLNTMHKIYQWYNYN